MEKSIDLFEQILSHGPSQSTLFLVLTKLKEEGRLNEVIHECRRSLGYYPDDIRLRKLLAESYIETGSIEKAEIELNKVVSAIEGLTSVFKLQARILSQQQKAEEAFEPLRRYLAFNPEDQEALDLIDRIKPVEEETIPEPPKISEDIGQVPEEQEDTFSELATPTLAEIYFNQGQIDDAISTYEEVIINNPKDAAAIKRLAGLRGLKAENIEAEVKEEDNLAAKKEKMIPVLEGWLARIQELNNA